ncbi:MAG: amino acid adenylation domain-containing protein [Ardenticatenaceae bacterium]|nr:amino acid adenylation domain-containing protein [Ardenticatenaceae bacterium]MCB9446042.1 amino acid adenylation domain-containing protein [Ardenticatenaceae bacterium]
MEKQQLKERLATLSPEQRARLLQELKQNKQKKAAITPLTRPLPTLPISFAQRRMWFMDQLNEESAANNMASALRLTGQLDVAAMEHSFQALIERHEILQCVYQTKTGEPVVVLHPNPQFHLPVEDLSHLPAEIQATELQNRLNREANTRFDLTQDLSLRAKLLRLAANEHVLLLTIHHIASDGWSAAVLFREWSQLYTAFCDGRTNPLPALPIQYADYAHWQTQQLQNGLVSQLDYWKEQLAHAPSVINLPTDRSRPAMQSHRGATHAFTIGHEQADAVRQLAIACQTTPFVVLLTVFQILLRRYSNQNDVVVGTPIAGRNQPEVEELIGLFINTLILRAHIDIDLTGRQLIENGRQLVLDAFSHQDLPVEKLVDELNLERTLSHNPLFQVLFNYLNASTTEWQLPDLTIASIPTNADTAKLDLSLALLEHHGVLEGQLNYNTDIFNAETIAAMAERYQILLAGIIKNPDQPVYSLPFVLPSETEQLEKIWHGRTFDYPADIIAAHQLFERQAERVPDAVALHYEFEHYTYRELNERANQLAHYLRSRGVVPDQRVGFFMDRSLDAMVAMLGILKAGCAYVPIDPIYPKPRIRFMLEDVQVSHIVTQASIVNDLPEMNDVEIICLEEYRQKIARYSKENPPLSIGPNNLMYTLFTSGSTGQPKAVAVSHRNYLNYLLGAINRMGIDSPLTFAMVTTLAADLGTLMWWSAFTFGGDVHILSYDRVSDGEAFAAYFRQYSIDVLKLVPSHYENLLAIPNPADIIPKKLLVITGEQTYWETIEKIYALNPNLVIQDHYGVTETTGATIIYTVPRDTLADGTAAIPKGTPIANTHIHILDEHLQPLPTNIPGEIFIGGAGVTHGYLNRSRLTAERFIPDPYSKIPGARLYRTGDLACYQPNGTLKLLGRIDHQVKIRGYRIETGEIESLLSDHESVQDAVVVASEDSTGDQRLIAYWVASDPDKPVSTTVLRNYLREHLPEYMVPSVFMDMHDGLPLNPNGKVDRFALPAPDYTGAVSDNFVPPQTEMEKRIAAIWCDVLGLDQVGIDDNFFDIGGESFKAIRAVRQLGDDVSVVTLFKNPTIRTLALSLALGNDEEDGLLVRLTLPNPSRTDLTLICVPYGGGSAITFQPVAQALPVNYALYALQFPGHDLSRQDEPLMKLEQVVTQCVAEILGNIPGPLALYGHCIGSAWAVEITRQLEAAGRDVVGVFLAGTFPIPRPNNRLFEWWARVSPTERWMSNRLVYDVMRSVGGFADLEDPAEQEFVMNRMRYDAREAEDYFTWAQAQTDVSHKAPILCIVGKEDPMTEFFEERILEWESFSPSVEGVTLEQAGHYFIKHQPAQVAKIITKQAERWQRVRVDNGGGGTAVTQPLAIKPTSRANRRPDFNTFLIVAFGQLISMLGTGLTGFAMSVWVLQKTGQVFDFSVMAVFTLLPGILASPFAGVVADRWDRRRVMILSDTAAAMGTLMVAILLWSNQLEIWHLFLSVSIGSIANAFQRPAYIAAVAQLVPKQQLGRANGVVQLAGNVGNIFSPLLGGALLVWIGLHGVVLVDVATFLFAITTLFLVRFPNAMSRQREETFRQQMVGGWRFIARRPSLRAFIIFFLVYNFVSASYNVLIPPLVLANYSESVLGTVLSMMSIGVLIGTFMMIITGGTKRRINGMMLSATLTGVAIATAVFRPTVAFLTMGLFLGGFISSFIDAHWQAIIQTKVPFKLQGRVIATIMMIAMLTMPLGFLLWGWLADNFFEVWLQADGLLAGSVGQILGVGNGRGTAFLLISAGLSLFAWGIAAYFYRPLRYMEDRLPDAVPEGVIIHSIDELQNAIDQQYLESIQ